MRISDWSSDVCSSDQPVSNRPEPTFARLRYSLGGDRPSQTTRHRGSLARFHGRRLDIRKQQGGISPMAPRELAPSLQRLPPMLHSYFRSEEHTPELQSLMRLSYAVFCLTKQTTQQHKPQPLPPNH